MNRLGYLAVGLAAALALVGCSGEDGADGDPYVILYNGCGCVVAVDLSDFGSNESGYNTGERYKLKAGTGEFLWQVASGTVYTTGTVTVEGGKAGSSGSSPGIPGVFGDGDDGKDRIYETTLYDGSYTVVEYFDLNANPPEQGEPISGGDLHDAR